MRADGSRRKWWRRSGGCRSDAASLSGGKFGRCRSVWRQVWPLQGCLAASLAAAGPLQCRYTRPPFNGAAAVKCFLLSSSLLFSSCMASNKNKNNTELQFSICILLHWCCRYRVALIGRGLIKVLHFNYSKFCCVN